MTVLILSLLHAVLGAAGGIVACFLRAEFRLPYLDRKARAWRPGWLCEVSLGAVAAVGCWCLYGPLGAYNVCAAIPPTFTLTPQGLLTSVLVGTGGTRVIHALVKPICHPLRSGK